MLQIGLLWPGAMKALLQQSWPAGPSLTKQSKLHSSTVPPPLLPAPQVERQAQLEEQARRREISAALKKKGEEEMTARLALDVRRQMEVRAGGPEGARKGGGDACACWALLALSL